MPAYNIYAACLYCKNGKLFNCLNIILIFLEALINKDLECYEGLYFIHFIVGLIGY